MEGLINGGTATAALNSDKGAMAASARCREAAVDWAGYRSLIDELCQAALHPGATVAKTIRDTGKKAVGCFPIYTPEEILYAAGFVPVGIWGGKTGLCLADKYLQSFCCSIMRSNLEYGMKGAYDMLAAVVIPAFCDTLKCMCENWKAAVPQIPVIPVVYPQNRDLEAGFAYLTAELKRVKGEAERIGGCTVTEQELQGAWELYETYRAAMREFTRMAADYPKIFNAKTRHLLIKAGWFMDKADYIAKIAAIMKGVRQEEEKKETKEGFDGIRVIATGLMAEPVELLSILEENGIAVAGDDLAQESRQFRVSGRAEGDVWQRMAWRTVDQRGCAFLYEERKTRGQMLIQMVREKQARAVVVFMMKFCDPEEFDYPIYKQELEEAGIPILYLEVDQQLDSFEQMRTRIQSFAEMCL